MAQTETLIPAHEFAAFPETSTPTELIGGRVVVSPSPTPMHDLIIDVLKEALKVIAADRRLGRWHQAPLDLLVTPYDVFQPHLMLFAPDQFPDPEELPVTKLPSIVVEVLSPGSRHMDLVEKLPKYASRGIQEYWVVDPGSRTITINWLTEHGSYVALPMRESPIRVGRYDGAVLPFDRIFGDESAE